MLNILILILFVFVAYLFYAFINRQIPQTEKKTPAIIDTTRQIIQIEVLNGCGKKGVAGKFMDYLRIHGIDVVNIKNYNNKTGIQETIVIDRLGDLKNAKYVAASLGVSEKNVIQQINQDYFVAVTVVIGNDYNQLKPMM
jgi:hypothetical protein